MLTVALVAVGALLASVALLWTFQRRLIYLPATAPVPDAAALLDGATDVTLTTDDGLALRALYLSAPGAACRATVLVAPGNAGNRAGRIPLARALADAGFGVLLMDYRGYGGNPGSPSEDGLAADADAAVGALTELGYPPHRTIYFGESLGTGVVAALQVRHPPVGIVLRSPYTELADVAAYHYPWLPVRALLRDRFPVVEHLDGSHVPITVIYGDRDSVVPPLLSARVADQAPSLAERVVIEGAEHNDPIMFGPRVADAVARLAQRSAEGPNPETPTRAS